MMESVFENAKLLERILSYVDLRVLLVSAQRVCRIWHTIILSSQIFQQRCFFLSTEAGEGRINPPLRDIFPQWFRDSSCRWVERHEDLPASSQMPKSSPQMAAILRRGASWRKMLVQQPAPLKLGYFEQQQAYFSSILSIPNRLTMGFLFDLMHQLAVQKQDARAWRLTWIPSDNRLSELHDEALQGWCEEYREVCIVLGVIRYDAWSAGSILELRSFYDRCSMDGWLELKCEEFNEVTLSPAFYYLAR
jgi:hypothetical protein